MLPSPILTDNALAGDLARRAGTLLVAVRKKLAGADPGFRGEQGDRRSAAFILEQLAARCPADAVLVEDAADDGRRLGCDRHWIVDPLGCTREFGEDGRDDWAALVASGPAAAWLRAPSPSQPRASYSGPILRQTCPTAVQGRCESPLAVRGAHRS